MATIIDSLLVTLGLNSDQFKSEKDKVDRGLRETGDGAERAGKRIKQTGKSGAEGFDGLAKSASKFLALIGGTLAIKRFVEQTVESNAALDRLSRNLQETVENVSAWSQAAEIAGGSADGLQGTLDMLSKSQTELMLTGQSQLIPYFSALGVSVADATGKARSGAEILLDLSERFGRMDRTTANNMGRMMGIDQGTMNLLLKGRSEVELMIRRQKETAVVTRQQAEEASRLRAAMVESRQSVEAFGRGLLSAAMPALEGFFSILKDIGSWVANNKEFVGDFLTVIAVGLGLIAAATIPVNLTVLAVTALSTAIAALWQDYQTWKRGGDSFIDWAKWEPGFNAAGKAIGWLKGLLDDLAYRAIAAADLLSAVFDRDWKRAKFAAKEFMAGTPAPTSPPAAAPAKPAVTPGVSPEQQALNFFQSKGWTREQAAGLTANIKRESNYNPAAVGDSGKAIGIAQWHPDRQAEFAKRYGKDIRAASYAEQLDFMNYELTEGRERAAGAKLRGAKSAEEAAAAVSTHYERPKQTAVEAQTRGKMAVEILAKAPTPVRAESYPERREAAGATPIPKVPAERNESPRSALAGVPGAAMAAQGAGAAPAVRTPEVSAAPASVSNSVETHIGEIKVITAATDAKGIAADMGKSMDFLFTSQANYGLI